MSTFPTILKYQTRQSGFSLIEFITVIVILSIVSMLGAGFVITSIQSYDRVAQRSKLIGSGRQALERITRQLRASLPYSLRLSNDASGLCVEFMPVVAGGNYIGPDYDTNGSVDQEELPTAANGAAPGLAYNVITAPFNTNIGSAVHLTVGGMSATEIYTAANPSAREEIGAIGTTAIVTVPLNGAHRFVRESINDRFYILDDPGRFCITGNQLFYYDNYTLPTDGLISIANGQPAGSNASLLADNIGDLTGIVPFQLSGATQDRNAVVNITIPFTSTDGQETIEQKQAIMIRNVP
jgi:MSHA biogenesis protein MshO